eukprot:11718106-Alexandrium_andersonii.AAC.1
MTIEGLLGKREDVSFHDGCQLVQVSVSSLEIEWRCKLADAIDMSLSACCVSCVHVHIDRQRCLSGWWTSTTVRMPLQSRCRSGARVSAWWM